MGDSCYNCHNHKKQKLKSLDASGLSLNLPPPPVSKSLPRRVEEYRDRERWSDKKEEERMRAG